MVSKRVFRSGLLALLALSISANCGGEDAPDRQNEVLLNVTTIDMSNNPVEMVRFYINGKKFGITNEDGQYKGRYAAAEGEVLAFNVEPPEGYSIPPNTDQNTWQITVKYPPSGKVEVDFTASLQRPERNYLFLVRTGVPATPIKVAGKLVGKTGETGDAMVRVSGVPGTKFTAQAGKLRMAGAVFAEEDEIYVLTDKKKGRLGLPGGVETADAAPVPAADPTAPVEPPPTLVAGNTPPPPGDDVPRVGEGTRPIPDDSVQPAPVVRDPDPVVRDPDPVFRDPDPVVRDRQDPPRQPDRSDPVVVARPDPADEDPLFDEITGDDPDPGSTLVREDPVIEPPAPIEPDPLDEADPIVAANVDPPATPRRRRQPKASGDRPVGPIDSDGPEIQRDAIDKSTGIDSSATTGIATMSRGEISSRVKKIKGSLGASNILFRRDVDFLKQLDETHPSYYEANRLLADYYYRQKDYKRQAASLEEATRRGRYKSDPAVLLSLAKAYAQRKVYRKALRTMRRVEAKMRRLPVDAKVDAYRFYAEMLEFEFLKESAEDPKRANISLIDKAITKWERVITLSGGGAIVSKARKRIEKLTQRKRDLEL